MPIPESDWRQFRALIPVSLERYSAEILNECRAILDAGGSAHERYLRMFRLIQDRDRRMASAFDDLRRSTAIQQLGAMFALDVVTDAELEEFSVGTRDAVRSLFGSGGQ
jgi:hypothetical protein